MPYPGGLVSLMFEGYSAIVDWEWEATAELVRQAGGEVTSEEYASTTWDEHMFDLRVAREGPTLLMNEVFVPLSRTSEVMAGMARILSNHKVPGGIVGTAASRSTASLMPYALVDRRKWVTFFAYGLVEEFANLAIDMGGRPAGVGLWMAHSMPHLHGKGLDAMVDIKRALDPKDIMNPGKLIHAVSKFDVRIPAAVMSLGTKTISIVHALLTEDGGRDGPPKSTKGLPSSTQAAELVEEERAEDLEEERVAMEAAEAGIRTGPAKNDGEGRDREA